MANNKPFKIKNGLQANRYIDNAVVPTTGAEGPSTSFSTTLYTGNGVNTADSNPITGVGFTPSFAWIKSRTSTYDHHIQDSVTGLAKFRQSNSAAADQNTGGGDVSSFDADGFTISYANNRTNASGEPYVAWLWKESSNFFDIVTYNSSSGNVTNFGSAGATVNHNLGSVPGMIIVKCTDTAATNWKVYHRGLNGGTNPEQYEIELNQTFAQADTPNSWNDTAPTSTQFTLGVSGDVNNASRSYVAYLFAHDTSDDGYIQCGNYTGTGTAGLEVNLGFKPQWLLIKNTSNDLWNWLLVDSERGIVTGGNDALLIPNGTNAESATSNHVSVSESGFSLESTSGAFNSSGHNFIYVAIRATVPTETLDLSTGNHFNITMTEATNILFTNPPASGTSTAFSLEVNNNGSTITWPTTIKWHENTTPAAASTKEVYTFITTDGGTTYYGKKAGENIS